MKELRIAKLTVENFKRVEVVEIEPGPDGGLVVIQGKNAQGKSSILDAIMAAFCGGREIPEMALREGTNEGYILVDLGEYVVERKFKLGADGKPTSSKLEVRTAEGAKFNKPQQILDEVIGRIGFDPLEFTRMEPKAQVKELIAVSDIELDPEAWAAKRKVLYDERTAVNKEAKKLAGAVAAMPFHDGLPPFVPSTSELTAKVKATQDRNFKRRELRTSWENIRAEITRLEAKAAEVEKRLEPEEPMEALEDELLAAEEMRNKKAANEAYQTAAEEVRAAGTKGCELTSELKKLDGARAQALAQAELPVDGLAFDESGVTYNGIPFGQCALSEQLTVSTAVAMAANPTLRVALIRDGSLLDSDGREALRKLAEAEGYQVWLECVEGKGGFEIHEGRVVA